MQKLGFRHWQFRPFSQKLPKPPDFDKWLWPNHSSYKILWPTPGKTISISFIWHLVFRNLCLKSEKCSFGDFLKKVASCGKIQIWRNISSSFVLYGSVEQSSGLKKSNRRMSGHRLNFPSIELFDKKHFFMKTLIQKVKSSSLRHRKA